MSESDFELVRLEVVVIHTVKMGLGVGLFARLHKGASVTFVRRKINGEVWPPATAIYEGSAWLPFLGSPALCPGSTSFNRVASSANTSPASIPPHRRLCLEGTEV